MRDNPHLKDSITDRDRYPSYFFSTQRNLVLYWLTLFAVLPAFIASVHLLMAGILEGPYEIGPLYIKEYMLWAGLWSLVAIPLLLSFLGPAHEKRGNVVAALLGLSIQIILLWWQIDGIEELMLGVLCVAYLTAIILYMFRNRLNFLYVILSLSSVLASSWLLVDVFSILNVSLSGLALPLMFLMPAVLLYIYAFSTSNAFSLVALLLVLVTVVFVSLVAYFTSNLQYFLLLFLPSCLLFLWFLSSILIYVRLSDANPEYRDSAPVLSGIQIFGIWLPILFILATVSQGKETTFAVLSLASLIIVSHPEKAWSAQRAYFRRVWFTLFQPPLRKQIISGQYSGTFFSQFILWIRNGLLSERPWLGLIVAALVGGVVIPLTTASGINWNEITDDEFIGQISGLFFLGTASAGIFTTLYLLVWFMWRRDRYIVEPFEVVSDESNRSTAHLTGMSNLLTHSLADQVQQISVLLSLRQVEDSTTDTATSLFVTSGIHETKIISQLQSLVSLPLPGDEQGKNFRLPRLLGLVRSLAVIRVRGTIQRLDDDSVRVWVELTRRGYRTVAVDTVNIPPNVADEMDDYESGRLMRDTAIKLILKLGQGTRLTTSPESMSAFLEGLQATTRRNWWRAVESFQRSVQADPKGQTGFAIGYYHLGSAHLFRGEFEEARKYLLQADMIGPTLPETQYMLALLDLIENWDRLNEDQVRFANIVRRCKNAVSLRADFPEAYHVLGSAYYQCGKLHERQLTRQYDMLPQSGIDYRQIKRFYRRSVRYMRSAIRLYRRAWRKLPLSGNVMLDVEREANRISRELVVAMHRLGDSLRSLGHFTEAESYYREVLSAYPTNIRTLTDLAKTYCLASNWQQADEFLSREVLSIPTAKWNVDVNIYVAWTLFGGVVSLKSWSPLNLLLVRAEGTVATEQKRRFFLSRLQPEWKIFELLGSAVSHLDYALMLRPRYMTRWRQTDWMTPILQVLSFYGNSNFIIYKGATLQPVKLYEATLKYPEGEDGPSIYIYLNHLLLWVLWRMHSMGYVESDDPFLKAIYDHFPQDSLYEHHPTLQLSGSYKCLQEQRQDLIKNIKEMRNTGRNQGIANAYKRLQIAEDALGNWHETHRKVQPLLLPQCSKEGVSFRTRWAVDVYAEVSLFAVRVLLEAGVYEMAYSVANVASKRLANWIKDVWLETYTPKNVDDEMETRQQLKFTFSHRVMRYQMGSLKAMRVYAAVRMSANFVSASRMQGDFESLVLQKLAKKNSKARSRFFSLPNDDDPLVMTYSQMQDEANRALAYVPNHPLAIFARGYVYRLQEQYTTAIDEANRLLAIVEPLDPNRLIGTLDQRAKRTPRISSYPEKEQQQPTLRDKMHSLEQVSGRTQFFNLVNQASIYAFLADVYQLTERLPQSADHRMMSIITSPHWDFDADQLFVLAETFDQLEQYADVHAVLVSLRARRYLLEDNTLSVHKVIQPSIFEAINMTRIGAHEHALSQTLRLLSEDPWYEPLSEKKTEQYKPRLPKSDKDLGTPDGMKGLDSLFNEAMAYLKKQRPSRFTELLRSLRESLIPLRNSEHVSIDGKAIQYVVDVLERGMHFKYIYDGERERRDILSEVLWLAQLRLNADRMADALKNLTTDTDHLTLCKPFINVDWLMKIKFIVFVALEAVRFLEQRALLHNSVTFNRTELYLDPQLNLIENALGPYTSHQSSTASDDEFRPYQMKSREPLEERPSYENIQVACSIVSFLYQMSSQDKRASYQSHARRRYARQLSLIYDTHGWYLYRRSLEDFHQGSDSRELHEQLQESVNIYENFALYYNQESAIVHYHLARVHVTLLERLWQTQVHSEDMVYQVANQVNYHLSRALRHWLRARERDYNKRLASRLSAIGKRIERYREAWDTRFRSTFKGEKDIPS